MGTPDFSVPALTALMTGDAHLTVLGTIIAVPQVKGGRLKGLAVASMTLVWSPMKRARSGVIVVAQDPPCSIRA